MKFKLEVIGFTIEGCSIAQEAGAHRIELCDSPADGGTTPSYGFIKAARKIVIDLYVMIRPRGGDFYYDEKEFEIMKEDVKACKKAGCDGIVIGMLTAKNKIDKERCAQLVNLAYPMGVTFHRAFDRTPDAFEALEDIIGIGCERILTSGQQPDAMAGKEMIAELIKRADERIIIMPGAGITADNISAIAQTTAAVEFHSSARLQLENKISVDKVAIQNMLNKLGSI
jgi:copper homeostasis protein